MRFVLPAFTACAALSWFFPFATASLALLLPLFTLACGSLLRARAEALMKRSPLYGARYWSGAERDALERFALYFNRPSSGPAFSRALAGLAGAAAGLCAGPWLPHGDWVFPALGLMAAAFCQRERRLFDPVAHHESLLARKDFSGSEEWGAIQEIRGFLNSQGVGGA